MFSNKELLFESSCQSIDQSINWLTGQGDGATFEGTDIESEDRVEIYEGTIETQRVDGGIVSDPVEHCLGHLRLTENILVGILVSP